MEEYSTHGRVRTREESDERDETFETACIRHGNERTTAVRTWRGGKIVSTVRQPCARCREETAGAVTLAKSA